MSNIRWKQLDHPFRIDWTHDSGMLSAMISLPAGESRLFSVTTKNRAVSVLKKIGLLKSAWEDGDSQAGHSTSGPTYVSAAFRSGFWVASPGVISTFSHFVESAGKSRLSPAEGIVTRAHMNNQTTITRAKLASQIETIDPK